MVQHFLQHLIKTKTGAGPRNQTVSGNGHGHRGLVKHSPRSGFDVGWAILGHGSGMSKTRVPSPQTSWMQPPRFDSQEHLIAWTWPDRVSWPQCQRPDLALVSLLVEVSLPRLDILSHHSNRPHTVTRSLFCKCLFLI